MDIRKLQRAIVDGLEDVKAQRITVFNTEHLSALFERVIIASGTSNRQTKALAASVRDAVKSRGMQVLATEGEDNGEWIIVDCGAAVAHIMQPAIRDYYHLEEIWGGKSVRVKVASGVGMRLPKAAGYDADDEDDAPAPAAPPRRAAPRKTAAASDGAPRKAVASEAAPLKAIALKGASSGKAAAGRAAPGDAAPRKAAPRKAAVKAGARPAGRKTTVASTPGTPGTAAPARKRARPASA